MPFTQQPFGVRCETSCGMLAYASFVCAFVVSTNITFLVLVIRIKCYCVDRLLLNAQFDLTQGNLHGSFTSGMTGRRNTTANSAKTGQRLRGTQFMKSRARRKLVWSGMIMVKGKEKDTDQTQNEPQNKRHFGSCTGAITSFI